MSASSGTVGGGPTEAPGITVVVPVYNRRELLERALLSVLGQTVAPAEVVVVDDGSTDGSAAVAERLGVTVIRQANAGSSAARNAGLRHASTPWVALLDSDDEWLPGHLEVASAVLAGHVLVSSGAVTNHGRLRGSLRRSPLHLARPDQLLWPENPVVTSAAVLHRETALTFGGFDERLTYNEDLDLWVKMLRVGRGVVLPDVTVRYRVHAAQLSTDGDSMHEQTLRLLTTAAAEGWSTSGVRRRVMAREHWDALRAQSSGWSRPGDHVRALVWPPTAWALGRLLWRRAGARRAAKHLLARSGTDEGGQP